MTDEKLVTEDLSKDPVFLEILRGLCLFDDEFMTVVFKEPKLAELLLRIILDKKDLTVVKCEAQYEVKNLYGRSVRLDIFAKDSTGKFYDVEVQREDSGAIPLRARYNSSLLDANIAEKGEGFDKLPETYMIFITENDYFRKNLPLYTVNRHIEETGEPFDDGAHIIYVNGQNREDTDLGRLMSDFVCKDPAKFNFKELGEATEYYKQNGKGAGNMSEAMRKYLDAKAEIKAEKIAEEKNKELALKAISKGKHSLEEIAELYDLTMDEVKELANGKSA